MTSVQARTDTAGRVGAPDLCRVTVLARHTEVDLALPLDVPVALLLPGVVDLIAGHRADNAFDVSAERTRPDSWTLARIGQAPLSGALSLDEHGIRDGDLLVLQDTESPAPPPLFDDVMYSVATSDEESYRRWDAASSAFVAYVLGPSALLAGCSSLLHLSPGGARYAAGAVCAVLPILLLAAATVLVRTGHDRRTATAFVFCAFPPAFTAGLLLVPGSPGAPHALLAATTACAVAIVALRITGLAVAAMTAVSAVCTGSAAVALVATTTDIGANALGAAIVVASLLLIGFAPRIAAMAASLPIPPVPTPGSPIESDITESDDNSALPSLAEIHARADRARAHLTGSIYGGTALAVAGGWAAALPTGDGLPVHGIALACVTAVVSMFRGRTYASAEQAVPLVAGGAVLLLGLIGGAAVAGTPSPWLVFGVAVVLVCCGFGFGVVAPRRAFTPVQRRVAELTEYAFIAAVVPLACWVGDVYSAVRGL